jgi:hypothetical protein
MAVTVQGYLALDLVKKNNVELVKGVDRASTTTVGALRTAVTVAQALDGQPETRPRPDHRAQHDDGEHHRFNRRNAARPDGAASMNRRHPAQSRSKHCSRAFQNIYDTMDNIDTFKLKALDSMKQTSEALEQEVQKSKGYIARAEGQAQALQSTQDSGLLASLEN